MRVFRFAAHTHEEFGDLGWLPDWIPGADPIFIEGVSHDVLEHISGAEDGSVNCELQALGAMLFIRGETDFWRDKGHHYPDWHFHAAGDVDYMLHKHQDIDEGWGHNNWFTPVATGEGSRPLNRWAEGQVVALIGSAIKQMKERDDDLKYPTGWEAFFTEAHQLHTMRMIRIGYRRAARKYRCPDDARRMFNLIADKAGKLIHQAIEGWSMLEVRIDLKEMIARVDMVEAPNAFQ